MFACSPGCMDDRAIHRNSNGRLKSVCSFSVYVPEGPSVYLSTSLSVDLQTYLSIHLYLSTYPSSLFAIFFTSTTWRTTPGLRLSTNADRQLRRHACISHLGLVFGAISL